MARASKSSDSLQSDFYNFIKLDDATGDATEGAPSYVDIKSLEIMQIGQYVQFVWEGNGNLYNNDHQYYFIVLDTDLNPNTGQYWGGSGGELKIRIYHDVTLTYFDEKGNVIQELYYVSVIFEDNRFFLNVEKEKIPSDKFNLYFESSGGTPYRDEGSLNLINLQPSRGELKVLIASDNNVLDEKPSLINIPYKNTPVQLNTYMIKGENRTELPNEEIMYNVYHPVEHDPRLGDPSSIISVDEDGTARYLREGYVFITSYYKEYHLFSEPVIVATGNIYGNTSTDNVIAVFPEDYRPDGSIYSFGDMMNNYPNYMKTVNLAYDLMREMYRGFRPFGGDRQILALLVLEGHCGGNNNPLETAPCCYMNCGNGEPHYNVVIHEMGHNFAGSTGMQKLSFSEGGKIGRAGFGEGVASLPVIYFAKDLYEYPEKYGFTKNSFEWQYYERFLEADIPYSENQLSSFENMINQGEIKGIFDNNGTFDGVAVFCSLFQQYVYEFTNDTNPYKQEVIKRFLNLFPDKDLFYFEEGKVETYFAAAFSAAIGHDVREKLRFWGFSIDDAYYNQVYPKLVLRLQDNIPPLTSDNYDGAWHTTDLIITLTATDNESGVSEISYRINMGPIQNVSTTGQPLITVESANNTLEYWSIDNAGNDETPHKILTGIKIDKTAPTGSIAIANGTTYKNSTSATLTLYAEDATSGVAQMRFSQDDITWTPWEPYSVSRSWTLTTGDGTKVVYVQFMDNAGLISLTYQDTIILDATIPVAIAVVEPRIVTVGTIVTFDAIGSWDNMGIVSYEWNYGDGTTRTGIITTHAYANPGTYIVTLTAEDAASNSAFHSTTVTVRSPETFPTWIVGAAIAALGIVVGATISLRKGK